MLVSELIKRKNIIKQKLSELEFYLEKIANVNSKKTLDNASLYGSVLNNMFELLDKYQNYIILLDRSNKETEISVGKSTIKKSDALILREIVEEKIRILTVLATNDDPVIDIPNLLIQRDKLIEEQILLNNAIEESDWGVSID
jgi:hypothetical protein